MLDDTVGPSALLATFIARNAAQPLESAVAAKAAYCLLDALGLALLAREETTTSAIASLCDPSQAPTAARIWSTALRVSLSDAVCANAVAVHAQFHDDTDYSSWTHPGSLIVPVAVSLGESLDSTLAEVLQSITLGYDAIEWLGARDIVARGLIEHGIRTSPTLGTLGAAASAAALYKLTEKQTRHAIGIASSLTGGVLEPVRSGSDEWRVQNASAARNGLLAAQLAQKGVAGAPLGIEGPKGIMRSLAGLEDIPAAWRASPKIDAILSVSAKPWAALGDNMSAVIAGTLIHAEGIDTTEIEAVHIKIWRHFTEYPGTSFRGPFARVSQAIASMAFGTATAIVYGEMEYDKPRDHREDERILRLIALTTIEPDDQGTPYDATVTVKLRSGRIITKEASDAGILSLFHDGPTAISLFEARTLRSGFGPGLGAALGDAVIDAAATGETLRIRHVLDRLLNNAHSRR